MTAYARWKAKEQRDLAHWREWLHSQDCVACGRNRVQMAHVGERGYGVKCSDVFALPLCPSCHLTAPDAQHNGKTFWQARKLKPADLIREHHERYLSEIASRHDLVAKFSNALAAAESRQGFPGTLQHSIAN